MLTNLTGTEILKAVNKLKEHANAMSVLFNTKIKPVGYATKDLTVDKIDLFKVVTNLSYNFNFGGKTFNDNYKDAELLLTGNIKDYKEINKYNYEMVTKIIAENKDIKDVKIYSGDDDENKKSEEEYYYIGKQKDWDFSKPVVINEIKTMQSQQFKAMLKNNALEEDLKFDPNNFVFEIKPENYMKFNNNEIDLRRIGENNILVNQNSNDIKNSEEALASIKEQFEFDGNESYPDVKWNGGKINRDFIA